MPVMGDRLGRTTLGCKLWVGLQDVRHAGVPAVAFAWQLAGVDRFLDERVVELVPVVIGCQHTRRDGRGKRIGQRSVIETGYALQQWVPKARTDQCRQFEDALRLVRQPADTSQHQVGQ
jgi:hypothetical protein